LAEGRKPLRLYKKSKGEVAQARADTMAGEFKRVAEECEGVVEECKRVNGEPKRAALITLLMALRDQREVLNGQVGAIEEQLEGLEEARADQAAPAHAGLVADRSADGAHDDETVVGDYGPAGEMAFDLALSRLQSASPAIRAALLMHVLATCFDDVLLHLSSTVDGQTATLSLFEHLISESRAVRTVVEKLELPDSDEPSKKTLLDRVMPNLK
jgi:hypothetical protein